MQLFLWPSGPKPPHHAARPPCGSDDRPGQSYENVELQNMATAEDEEQMTYVNTIDAEKQNNAPVSKVLANQAFVELKFVQIASNIVNGKTFIWLLVVDILMD